MHKELLQFNSIKTNNPILKTWVKNLKTSLQRKYTNSQQVHLFDTNIHQGNANQNHSEPPHTHWAG